MTRAFDEGDLSAAFAKLASVLARVSDPLTSPAAFFAREDGRSLREPAAVVLLSGFVLVCMALPLLWLLRFVVPAGQVLEIAGVVTVLLPAYVAGRWLVLTAVVYGTGRLLGGEGRARELLAYLGWSFLPNVLAGAVLAVATTAVVAGIDAPASEAALGTVGDRLRSPLFHLASAASFAQAEAGVSLSGLQWALGAAQFAWNAYIWFAAAKIGLSLDDRRALLAISVPVVFTAVVAGHPNVYVGVTV